MTVPRGTKEEPAWRISSFSGPQQECVEAGELPDGSWVVRNSNDPQGPVVRFTAGEWRKFVLGVKNNEFEPR